MVFILKLPFPGGKYAPAVVKFVTMANFVKLAEAPGNEIYVNADLVRFLRKVGSIVTIYFDNNHSVAVKGELDAIAVSLVRSGIE